MLRFDKLALLAVVLGCGTLTAGDADPAPPPTAEKPPEAPKPEAKPITAAKGELADLLTAWWKEGTAAGNIGDRYDNRDGAHSMLDLRPYPQLELFPYNEAERKAGLHWAFQRRILDGVVFGNSSTSAGILQGGSNIRRYYANPEGMKFLYEQYRKQQLYMYPEHRDHDPGRAGPDGYGDVYAVNSPYLIASQGSSGSDQPFMKAIPFALAAFRPEVKKKLIETGLLMPTLQLLLRSTNKHLKSPEEYLTGKAHPAVFEGSWVDALAMVKRAHELTLEALPPLALLKVVEEEKPTRGIDYFDPHSGEALSDTPCVIGRLWRGRARTRRMVVSAADSFDAASKPLTFKWVVLRGDPERIAIKPLDDAGTKAELLVSWHERRPSDGPGSIESSRVDIGVFAHNGVHYSPPSFICFTSFDHEARTYAPDGRILEIGYGAGEASLQIHAWPVLFKRLDESDAQPLSVELRKLFDAKQLAALRQTGVEYLEKAALETAAKDAWAPSDAENNRLRAEIKKAEDAHKAAVAAAGKTPDEAAQAKTAEAKAALDKLQQEKKNHEPQTKKLREAYDAAKQAAAAVLDRKLGGLDLSAAACVQSAFEKLALDPELLTRLRGVLDAATADPKAKAAFENALKPALEMSFARKADDGRIEWTPLRAGAEPLAERLTNYERGLLQRVQHLLLAKILWPDLLRERFEIFYVDPLLSIRKLWRDVYRHDPKGEVIGWTRYAAGAAPADFHADGWLIVERDAQGRPSRTQAVNYTQPSAEGKRPSYPSFTPLEWKPDERFRTYRFKDEADLHGTHQDVPPPEAPKLDTKTDAKSDAPEEKSKE
ncbi:MAG: hypothetical protein AMXMBFR7_50680 [Planctomycetota bacterium]